MGQQLIQQITYFHGLLLTVAEMNGISIEEATYLMTIYDLSIPEEYKSFIQGISDATGLTYYEVMFQVTWLDLYYGILIPMMIQEASAQATAQMAACSALGSDKTIGQNFDVWGAMGPTIAYVKYTILGRHPTTVFSLWTGAFCQPVGKNHRDLMMVVNLLQIVLPGDFGTPTSIKTMMAFETARTSEQCLDIMLSSFPAAYNYIITDRRNNGFAVQTIPINPYLPENIDIQEIDTFAVRTNTYLRPDFFAFLIDPTYSAARQVKAEELTDAEYNDNRKLSTSEIIDILQYNDGTDASLNRPFIGLFEPTTSAFISMNKHYIKFGIGVASDDYGVMCM